MIATAEKIDLVEMVHITRRHRRSDAVACQERGISPES
jgi:hypothetical protein